MKLVRISEDSISKLQKFVKFQTLCVFYYCDKNVDITLYVHQDDSLYILVHDKFEEMSFYFQLFNVDYLDISFSKFRKCLIRLYFRFLDDYRERFSDLPF